MNTTKSFSVCIYCGSRAGLNPEFTEGAIAVGKWIGAQGAQLVYGGGSTGLMGAVADATREAGGRIIGIIPQALVDSESAYQFCDELHVVNTMHERKSMMSERADAFLAMPGGIGTFEELFEMWAWQQIGYHSKPVGLLNCANYYDGLIGFLRNCFESGMIGQAQMDALISNAEATTVLNTLRSKALESPSYNLIPENV
ncbi:LOG family protein [Pseudomonas putida]|uniref:Cytokinin riboside 5'-monophosphate phosphoribohydrolase n=1 Tax=Pseudomonas putida TaxID=303 RepID=A0A1Q9R2Q4_PSEPU|nr:TIGR00730 family Rossman fold protein [Pseudomonas putida]OLS61677.1 LOG family protein YvdD [Pseudomonas putida]